MMQSTGGTCRTGRGAIYVKGKYIYAQSRNTATSILPLYGRLAVEIEEAGERGKGSMQEQVGVVGGLEE